MTSKAVPPPKMALLPGGEFLMGESDGDKFANNTERPAHRVKVEPFALGCFAVTVGEYRAFRPDHSPDDRSTLPVVNVNWDDAQAYCQWLSAHSGQRYRLPTETEWEYACRAGTRTPFTGGHEITPREANYFYSESGERIGPGHRTAGGEFPANAFGLYDMHGNVCEWCEDAWRPDYAAPPERNGWRAIRGGAWDYLPRLLRSAWRDGVPAHCRRDNLGFRIATSDLSA